MRMLGLLLALAAAGPSGAADAPATGPLSVEEATAKSLNWGFDLSPSGRYLASVRRVDKYSVVVIVDLQDEKAPPALRPIPNSRIDWFEWATDDRLLVAARFWIGKHNEPIPTEKFDDPLVKGTPVMRLFGMDRDGGNFKMMFADNEPALWSRSLANIEGWRDNRRQAMIPAWQFGTYDLFSVDVHTGASKRIAKGTPRTFQWFTDANGDPAFRIDATVVGKYAWVFARKGPADVAYDKIQWEKVQEIRLKYEGNEEPPEFWPVRHGPDANTYYVAARPDGVDTTGIYLYDYLQQKYLKTIALEPGIDIEGLIVDTKGNFLAAEYYADRKVHKFAEPKLQAYFNAADRYFGGEVDTFLLEMDDTRQVWLLYTNGPRDSGSWHVFRLKDKHIREVAHRLPGIDRQRLGPARIVRYKARDGLDLMGYLTLPPGHKPGDKPPLVLMPHGGPASRDNYGYDPLVQLLATRGYQVFQPNFRGSSGFGRRFLESGFRSWGLAMQDDLTDGVEFLVKSGYAEPGRACIAGASYGGYAALAGATLTPDLYRCVISISGVSHLPRHIKHKASQFGRDREFWIIFERMFGDTGEDAERLNATSPANLAAAVKVPILLIHGDIDEVVAFKQSEIMDEALRKAGKDVRFVKIGEMAHSPTLDEYKKLYPPVLEFLEKHLPVDEAAAAAP